MSIVPVINWFRFIWLWAIKVNMSIAEAQILCYREKGGSQLAAAEQNQAWSKFKNYYDWVNDFDEAFQTYGILNYLQDLIQSLIILFTVQDWKKWLVQINPLIEAL